MVSLDSNLLNKLDKGKLSLEDIDALEKKCFFSKFDSNDAFGLGIFIRNTVLELFPEKSVAINISLMNDHTLFHTIVGVASNDNDYWIARKKRTAKRFGHSSYYMRIAKGDKKPEEKFFVDVADYAFHGGAVPIYLENCDYPIAILTVSGLKQHEDHLLAVNSIIEYANQSAQQDLNLD
ncbi:Uncharacterized protein RNJ44_03989 [Nakaseomyces bracarensis]|uniref:Uncharacterized protein n=1 Tax=Nakaseomyces bracarensis TaxID=273131 RepID=A0ABR4NTT8_9SACH